MTKLRWMFALLGATGVALLCHGQSVQPVFPAGGVETREPQLTMRGVGPFLTGTVSGRIVLQKDELDFSDQLVDTEETQPKLIPQDPPASDGKSLLEALQLLPNTALLKQPYGESLYGLEANGQSAIANVDALSQTPSLTTCWPKGATANHSNDPQIAAGTRAVAVLTWGTLAFYDKGGTLLPSKGSFSNPTFMSTLFQKTVQDLDTKLNLNPTVAGDPSFLLANGQIGDARVEFDTFRKRWVVLATAKNNLANKVKWAPSWIWSQRRTKFLLAISIDEDPADGFRTYGFDATPNDGACNAPSDVAPCPGTLYTPGNGGDYPSIGITTHHYLLTSGVAHQPLNGSQSFTMGGFVIAAKASDLANGVANPLVSAYYHWDIGQGERAMGSMPVVSRQALLPIDYGFLAVAGTNRTVLTAVTPTDPPVLVSFSFPSADANPILPWSQPGSKRAVSYANLGHLPVKATQIGGIISLAFNDARNWMIFPSLPSPSIHLMTFNLNGFPTVPITVIKERVFGLRSTSDDNPNDVVAYGLPGTAMNKNGDLAVVYSRTSPLVFPEVRFSTWIHGEPDIRPSRRLHPGGASFQCSATECKDLKFDTAGVALDPYDATGIWMAHNYVSVAGTIEVAIGKVFGQQHPGLQIDALGFTSEVTTAGHALQMSYTIANRGDAPATGGTVEFYVFRNTGVSEWMGTATLPTLAAGEKQDRGFGLTVPQDLTPGQYTVWAIAKVPVAQYTDGFNAHTAEHYLTILSLNGE